MDSRHYSKSYRITASLVLIMAIAMSSYGCNTTKGVGKDVERMGEAVQDAAK